MRKTLTLGLASLLLAIPFASSAQEAYTTRSVNVRSGPDTSYPPVAALAPGAPVQVMGCLDDWSWCDVVFDDNRGWIYAPYVNYVYQGARVPFYAYAPSFGIPIVTFSVGSYWDRYYRGRSWYGRRDYWEHRAPPRHVRPSGPPPRATTPSHREREQFQRQHSQSNAPAYAGNRGTSDDNRFPHDGRSPSSGDTRPSRDVHDRSSDQRSVQSAPSGTPSTPHSSPEMRRGPAPQSAPPPAAREGAQRGAPSRDHSEEGSKGRGSEHGKEDKH